jgi:hypothetical protein
MTLCCKYSDILGVPNKGFHKFNGLGDVILTLVLAWVTSHFSSLPLTLSIIFWLVLSIFIHWIFCVKSITNVFLKIN